jgi:hypothetical protein
MQELTEKLHALWGTGLHFQTVLATQVDVGLPADKTSPWLRWAVLLEEPALADNPTGPLFNPG